ncbi:esterase/lipase family protein [Nocardia ignorata]|uniref:esterase/lipase family protein n=1 Tax=Nocardia ignorata TaxID=145285 RepID=UPI00362E8480
MVLRRHLALLVAAVIGICIPTWTAPATTAEPACQNGSQDRKIGALNTGRHPLVLVHGWLGPGEGMGETARMIADRMPDTFDTLLFEYPAASAEWAASPNIATCLARFLNKVSDAHRAKGQDGKVFVVAHSMGGLAARFATHADYTEEPATDQILGGITTVATPHLGSQLSELGSAVRQFANRVDRRLIPPMFADLDSDALHCLARHDRTRKLPSPCKVPPYLPSGVPLGQVAGNTVIRRTLAGFHLYDVNVSHDGMVTVASALGYAEGSGPTNETPPKLVNGSTPEITCVHTSEEMGKLIAVAGGGIAGVAIAAAATALDDREVADQVERGEIGPNLALLLGQILAYRFPCSHNALPTNAKAIDAVVDSLRSQLDAVTDPKITTLRPFTTDGNTSPGWSADSASTGPIDCTYSTGSPSAVSDGIAACSPSAAAADSCAVNTTGKYALCLTDPFAKSVARNTLTGSPRTEQKAPKDPKPIAIVLDDGTRCRLRIGGSWPVQAAAPKYVGHYSCTGGSGFLAVWAPPNGPGYRDTSRGWEVEVGAATGPLTTRRITEAIFVGTRDK